MSYNKIQAVVDNWVRCRKSAVNTLRRCANTLESSHKENADVEHTSAKVSLTGDVVGLCGVLVAPLSGGLSLGLCAVSAVTGIGSYLDKRKANQNDEKVTKHVDAECKLALDEDGKATKKLKKLCETFNFLEKEFERKKINDILVEIQETLCTDLTSTFVDIRSSNHSIQNGKSNIDIPGLGVATKIVNFKAALTSPKEITNCIKISKEVVSETKNIKQVVSTATSVNNISKAAQSLANAKKTAVISMQASQPAANSASLVVGVARGTDGVVKTAGTVSAVSLSNKRAVDIINASGQIAASTAQTATKAAGAEKVIGLAAATNGANTIKTVKNLKQTSHTVKTVTQATQMNSMKVTKLTQTATKAASISKVGLAINAVAIPLDVYNLVVASNNLGKSHEDVNFIRNEANRFENEIENIHEEIRIQVDAFTLLHVQLCQVYQDHQIDIIYEYLQEMHRTLEFALPSRF